MLVACTECEKQISDKALSCPHCGNPMKSPGSPALVQFATAPRKRRKYKIAYLIFMPLLFIGMLASFKALLLGGNLGLWLVVAVLGLIGSLVSAIGHWLAEP